MVTHQANSSPSWATSGSKTRHYERQILYLNIINGYLHKSHVVNLFAPMPKRVSISHESSHHHFRNKRLTDPVNGRFRPPYPVKPSSLQLKLVSPFVETVLPSTAIQSDMLAISVSSRARHAALILVSVPQLWTSMPLRPRQTYLRLLPRLQFSWSP
jgi:hypothetical protein